MATLFAGPRPKCYNLVAAYSITFLYLENFGKIGRHPMVLQELKLSKLVKAKHLRALS